MGEVAYGLWRPATCGAGKLHWWVCRDTPGHPRGVSHEGAEGRSGKLRRFGSYEAARRAADALNRGE